MRLYTSYYARVPTIHKLYPQATLLGISTRLPDFIKDDGTVIHYQVLAPPIELIKAYKAGQVNPAQYARIFNKEVLSHLNPKKIFDDFRNMSGGDTVVMLCYETPNDFCHRSLVRSWLNREVGCGCVELSFSKEDEHFGLEPAEASIWSSQNKNNN